LPLPLLAPPASKQHEHLPPFAELEMSHLYLNEVKSWSNLASSRRGARGTPDHKAETSDTLTHTDVSLFEFFETLSSQKWKGEHVTITVVGIMLDSIKGTS
jgi:hypothetical protein